MWNHLIHALIFAAGLSAAVFMPSPLAAVVVFVAFLIYSFLSPLESPFYPALFATVVAVGWYTVYVTGPLPFRCVEIAVFSGLYYVYRLLRTVPAHAYRIYLTAMGMLVLVVSGHTYYHDPNASWILKEFIVAVVSGVLLFEFFGLWGRLYPERSMSVRRRTLAALLIGFMIVELHWALALLPIGFLNLSALLGLFFVFCLDMFWRFHHNALTSRQGLRNGVLVFVVAGIILGLSRWMI